jgi:hypothetical protein
MLRKTETLFADRAHCSYRSYAFVTIVFASFLSRIGFAETRVVGWGNNFNEELNVPADLTNAVAVAAASRHSIALRNDGTVVAWGGKYLGEPRPPDGLSNVVAVSAGLNYGLALRLDGTVTGWGDNSYGQSNPPRTITNAVAVAAGYYHSMALLANGTVAVWGDNRFGQASPPPTLTKATAICVSAYDCFALRSDGTVVAWGRGPLTPPQGLSNVKAITAGFSHVLALMQDGSVVGWGDNDYGELDIPGNLSNVAAISAGEENGLALTRNGEIVGWGLDNYGQATPPPGVSNVVAIAAGEYHSLAIVGSALPLLITIQPPNTNSVLFRQTGLMWHVVRAFNVSAFDFPATRVVIHGLPQGTTVYNASGTNSESLPYVQVNRTLAPGAFIDLTIEYFFSDRSIPTPTLTGEFVDAEMLPDPTGIAQPIDRSIRLANGYYLIDFSTLVNRTYYVQYSTDLMAWKTAYPPIVGSGSRIQWVDNGPPKTETNPSAETNRFYRVILTP